jgi:hypothetical protein
MALIKSRIEQLTENDIDLLRFVYNCGGYVMRKHVDGYTGKDTTWNYRRLQKLVDLGFLKVHYGERHVDPDIYQVTASTCSLFLNRDSYYRKRHDHLYICRALMKAWFVTEQRALQPAFLFHHDDRLRFFTEHGFKARYFPTKKDRNGYTVHFEELALNFTSSRGLKLQDDGRVLFEDTDKKLIMIYFDKPQISNVRYQIQMFLKRYLNMMDGPLPLAFLVVTDNESRARRYAKNAELLTEMNEGFGVAAIPQTLFDTYIGFWSSYYKNNRLDEYDNFKQRTMNADFKNSTCEIARKTPLGTLTESDKKMLQILKNEPENGASIIIKELLQSGNEDRMNRIKKTFDRMFQLYAHGAIGPISQLKNIDLKVYQIEATVFSEKNRSYSRY